MGSASTMTTTGGSVVHQARFLPFGGSRTWGSAPTTAWLDRGYTGHLHNDGVGLIYMNARYYVPSLGRFASADTIVPDPTNPQQFNRFSYTLNNPLNYKDFSGHDPWWCSDASCIAKHTYNTPSWWNDSGRYYIEGYSHFDKKHILRGYDHATSILNKIANAVSSGGGLIDIPRKKKGDSVVNQLAWIYPQLAPEEQKQVALALSLEIEVKFEAWQGSHLLEQISSFAPEDLPSVYIGAWAAVNGYDENDIPSILQALGQPYPDRETVGAYYMGWYEDGSGGYSYGFIKNYKHTPVVEASTGRRIPPRKIWINRTWPLWLDTGLVPPQSGKYETIN